MIKYFPGIVFYRVIFCYVWGNKVSMSETLNTVAIKAEYDLIVEALKKTRFNKSRAAKLLGVDRKTLYNKLKAYELLTNG